MRSDYLGRLMRSNALAHYQLRPEALAWLAKRNKRLRDDDGKPVLRNIAAEAGIDVSTLHRANNLPAGSRLGSDLMSGLVYAAIRTGVSRGTAECRLFNLVTAHEGELVS